MSMSMSKTLALFGLGLDDGCLGVGGKGF
jgi:hypothetical protein